MSWWRWCRRAASDSTREATGHLDRLTARDSEVRALSRDLKRPQVRDHFSELVDAAITRTAQEGR